MIAVSHLTKEFRLGSETVRALSDVSFQADRGEFVAVIGPSGSGKSTLLMSLGGLIHPTDGKVRIGGLDIYAQPHGAQAAFRRKTIGFVFQQFHLIPYLTAWENVALALMLNGTQQTHHRDKAVGLLEGFGLESRVNHKPYQLSVGQQQRVAMARTLANDPDVILADEPTANLDPSLAQNLMGTLKTLNQQGKTIVMVTHSKDLADVATHKLELHEGRIRESQ